MESRRRWLSGAVLLILGVLTLGSPPTSRASEPQTIAVAAHGILTGPNSAVGTFEMSGLVSDAGTYSEVFRFEGATLHVEKTLTGDNGTVTLVGQGVVRWTSPTTATFFAGHWRFASGTGAYADLHGGGSPGALGSADLSTGTVEVVHAGRAQIG